METPLAIKRYLWEIPPVKTVKADEKKRVRIPAASPGQVFAYDDTGNGTITLTPLKRQAEEPFPPGSLAKYFTKEKDAEETAIASGCIQGPLDSGK